MEKYLGVFVVVVVPLALLHGYADLLDNPEPPSEIEIYLYGGLALLIAGCLIVLARHVAKDLNEPD